jgi:hypothetical protein
LSASEQDIGFLPGPTDHLRRWRWWGSPPAVSLRRTFASVLHTLGESPPVVMAEMGHTSPALALRVYAQAMRRDEGEQTRLRAFIESAHLADAGAQLADIGSRGESAPIELTERQAA